MSGTSNLRTVLLFVVLICAGVRPASAHDFAVTDVLAVFKTNGTFQVDMTVDIDALALGVSPKTDSTEVVARLEAMSAAEFEAAAERARSTILNRVRLRFDGEKYRPEVVFPEFDSPSDLPQELPSVLGTTARLRGRVPEGAREFGFGASRAMGPVHLTVFEQSTRGSFRTVLARAEDSTPFVFGQSAQVSQGRLDIGARYLILGFAHILPKGVDHILFVLGLFLLSVKWRPLLWQISAFTVAHSVSLGLSMAGLIALPSRWVESLIALSIAYVAIENLMTTELKPWRPAMVFAFGLLHGLGFAGVLRELGLPQGEFLTSLVAFNVGVEAGQLAVVALAFLCVGWFRHKPGYRPAVVLPLSALIAIIGLYWSIERAFWGV